MRSELKTKEIFLLQYLFFKMDDMNLLERKNIKSAINAELIYLFINFA